MNQQLTTHPAPIAELVADAGLDERRGLVILETFGPLFVEAETFIRDAGGIDISDASQHEAIALAADLMKNLKTVRLAVESARVELKADSLKLGKGIDNVARMIRLRIEPAEARMKDAANFAENARLKREAALALKRAEQLRPFGTDATFYNLGAMDEARFTRLYEAERVAFEAREQEKKDAAERGAREKAQREAEAALLREENERLREERFASDRAAMAERRELERVAGEERARADAATREAAEHVEASRRLMAKVEETNREVEEARARVKRQLEKQMLAPDAEKLRELARRVKATEVPEMSTPRGKAAAERIAQEFGECADWIHELAGAL